MPFLRVRNLCYTTLALEQEGVKAYYERLYDKAAGATVGFAIGDALGFPAAGIDKADIPKFMNSGINDFTSNFDHPYFADLKPGQFTDNTFLLMSSADGIIQSNGFHVDAEINALKAWGQTVLAGKIPERWTGPTALRAIERLIEGQAHNTAGSTTTQSCSSIYRVVPLGIYYRMFYNTTPTQLTKMAEQSGMITHNSEISKTGAALVALMISNLLSGVLPESAALGAVATVTATRQNALLLKNMRDAIVSARTTPIEEARKRFGTGSPIYQTLPLATFCFLKHQNSFRKAVLAAANSYRDDTPEEKERLAVFSWKQQLRECRGGNTDGIAALTGAFSGAYLGFSSIPELFRRVEKNAALIALGRRLVA